jgi:hypothetical protein
VQSPRATHRNLYVRTRRAGERVMASITRFLAERLRLKINAAKSAVDRPWVTAHKQPRRRVAAKSVARLRDKTQDDAPTSVRVPWHVPSRPRCSSSPRNPALPGVCAVRPNKPK